MLNRMKEIREVNELRQWEVANAMGIKRSTYAVLENSYNIIPLRRVYNFVNYFKVSIDYIFGLTNKKQYDNALPDIDYDRTKNRLKQTRIKNNYTQIKLAKFLNTSPSVWCDYEHGRYLVSTTFIYEFAKKFNVSIDWLLGKID